MTVNTELLFGEERFVFNPFEDIQVTFRSAALKRVDKQRIWFWLGIPAESVVAERRLATDEPGAEPTIRSILNGNPEGLADFAINAYSVNSSNGMAALDGSEPEAALSSQQPESQESRAANDTWERDAFRTISGQVQIFEQPSTVFMIRPLRLSPRYHLVWEIEPQYWGAPWHERNAAYNERMDSLGREPRDRPVLSVIE